MQSGSDWVSLEQHIVVLSLTSLIHSSKVERANYAAEQKVAETSSCDCIHSTHNISHDKHCLHKHANVDAA